MNWQTKKILSDFITVIVVCGVLVFFMSGCASIPTVQECEALPGLTPEQRTECVIEADKEQQRRYEVEDAKNQRLDIWNLCVAVYRHFGKPTFSKHSHDPMRAGGRVHTDDEVRSDILVNDCMYIWRQAQRRQNR